MEETELTKELIIHDENPNVEVYENEQGEIFVEGENIEFAVVEDENAIHIMPVVDGEIVETPAVEVEVFNEEQNEENVEPENVIEEEHTGDFIPAPVYDGVVFGCKQLNVRENPNKDAKIVCVVPEGKALTFEPSDDDFYKVNFDLNGKLYTGYCMKKFINHK